MGAFIEFRKYLKTKYGNILEVFRVKKSIRKKSATTPQFRTAKDDPKYLKE